MLLRPWDFPGKNTGVGCHFFLQGIFQTQGSNPGLPHCRQTLYRLSCQGSSHVILTSVKVSVVLICFSLIISDVGPSLVAQTVKRLPTMRETRVRSLGQEDPLEKETATHSNIHAWKIPWT